MSFITRQLRLSLVLLPVLFVPVACFDKPADAFFIIARPEVATFDKQERITLNPKCESGEQLLGGAYIIFSGPGITNDLALIGNYPSAENTWTVIVDPPPDKLSWNRNKGSIVLAHAYCLTTPNFPLDMVTVSAKTLPGNSFVGATASCPSGSVLTGGGYLTENVGGSNTGLYNAEVSMSAPAFVDKDLRATGWRVELAYVLNETIPTTWVYARCAGKNLASATVVDTVLDITKAGAAAGDWEATAWCPPNTFTTGGGYWMAGDAFIPHPVSKSHDRGGPMGEFGWSWAGWRAYQGTQSPFRTCDPNANPDCAKTSVVAACIPIPNIPMVKVKITAPPDGSLIDFTVDQFGHESTNDFIVTAEGTFEDGTPLTNEAVTWYRDSIPVGTGLSLQVKSFPITGLANIAIVAVAQGKTTTASDRITIQSGGVQ